MTRSFALEEKERRSTRGRRRAKEAPEEEAGTGKKGKGRTGGGGATDANRGRRRTKGEWRRRSGILGWRKKGRRFWEILGVEEGVGFIGNKIRNEVVAKFLRS